MYINQNRYVECIKLTDTHFKNLKNKYDVNLLEAKANAYTGQAKYQKADSIYKQIMLSDNYKKSNNYIKQNVIGNYATLKVYTGQYNEAIKLLHQAIDIKTPENRADSANIAALLNNLGYIYDKTAHYIKALNLYKKSIKLKEKIYNKGHRELIATKFLIGSIYLRFNNFDKALEINKEVLNVPNITDEDKGLRYNQKARIFLYSEKYDKAIYNFEKSLKYKMKDNFRATILSNYANALISKKQILKAKVQIKKAIQLRQKLYKSNKNIHLINEKNKLIKVYILEGKLDSAEIIAKENLNNLQNISYNGLRLDREQNLLLLSIINVNKNKFSQANRYFFKLFESYNNVILKRMVLISERQKNSVLDKVSNYNDVFISTLYDNKSFRTEKNIQQVYTNITLYKNLTTSAFIHMKKQILASNDDKLKELLNEYIQLKKIYSKQENQNKKNTKEIIEKIERIELQLTAQSEKIASFINSTKTSYSDVIKKLNKDEAIVDFTYFRYYNGKELTDSIYYCAIILQKNKKPQIEFLFKETDIINKFKKESLNSKKTIENLYNYSTEKCLYNLIWRPIEAKLENVKKILLSPAGILHRISFDAIQKEDSHYLFDNYHFEYLSNSKNRTANNLFFNSSDISSIAIFGDIDYETDTLRMKQNSMKYKNLKRGLSNLESFKNREWSQLSHGSSEIKTIQSTLSKKINNVNIYTKSKANEEAFKNLGQQKSPDVIFVSTHGFYLQNKFKIKKNNISSSMFRSGLIFSGANNTMRSVKIPKSIEDGVLYSYELSNLNFSNTKLAMLSACQTGLGDIDFQGVYGLQRAFKKAGAQNLIVSLWEVSDKSATEFTTTFFEIWTEGDKNINLAFRETQQKLKNNPEYSVYDWAAFIILE